MVQVCKLRTMVQDHKSNNGSRVIILLIRFGLLSIHLLGNICLLGWPFVLIVICLLWFWLFSILVLRVGLPSGCSSSCSLLCHYFLYVFRYYNILLFRLLYIIWGIWLDMTQTKLLIKMEYLESRNKELGKYMHVILLPYAVNVNDTEQTEQLLIMFKIKPFVYVWRYIIILQ